MMKDRIGKGPDDLFPADSFYANKLNDKVLLRSTESDLKEYPPISIYSLFKKTVELKPNSPAIAYKSGDIWRYHSYLEYWQMCEKSAKSFIKLGLRASNCVSIMGFNSTEWFVSSIGSILAGGVSTGIYTTNSVEGCEHVFKDCQSEIVVVENKQLLDKVIKCMGSEGVKIKSIIQYKGEVENNHNGLVMGWTEFLDYGNSEDNEELDNRIRNMGPNKCATLIYTSGTTGLSKAAMISQDSITYLTRYISDGFLKLKFGRERFVSYLPLSHIAAQSLDIYCSIYTAGTTYFAQPDALKGSLNETLMNAKPTFFFAVPRVLEKFQEKLEGILKKSIKEGSIKSKMFNSAKNTSSQYTQKKFYGNTEKRISYSLAKKLVLNKIHKQMGLDSCEHIYSGAAPITKETLDFFHSIGLPVCEIYGMSESTGPHCLGLNSANRLTSVGIISKYNRSKIINMDAEGTGELCMYGRHCFMGYLNNKEKTKDTYDHNDWLCTGDIAKIDNDGYIYITGRLKELIITAGGENVAPVPIEDNIKAELSHLLSNCMLVGDKRKFLVVLVTLKCKINQDTQEPTDELTRECIEWLESIGSKSTKVSDVVDNQDPLVNKEIENGIKRANVFSPSRAATVQKFEILPKDFSLANGELGPTLKLRRPIVSKIYSSVIENLYKDK